MTAPVFPDIDEALGWYVATKDGLWGLREAIGCGATLSDATLDELFGMTASLLELFRQRNDLAHGRVLQGVAFEPVYERMCLIREKWRNAVSDFRGY